MLEHDVAVSATALDSLLAIAVAGGPPRVGRTPAATNLRKNESIADDVRLHSPSRAGASCIDALLEQIVCEIACLHPFTSP